MKTIGKIFKWIVLMFVLLVVAGMVSGCATQAEKVSHNLSLEADSFNNYRQLTVINCIQGDVLFQMTGLMSIKADTRENQLEVTVELEDGTYKKHIIGLSDNVTYVLEDITSSDVSQYRYTLNFNPKMWIPAEFKTVD